MRYVHFSKTERYELSILLKKGYSLREIGSTLGRSPSSVSREIRRNSVLGSYQSEKAQHKAYVKRRNSKYQGMKVREHPKLESYIREKIRVGWSPERIAGRWNREPHGDPSITAMNISRHGSGACFDYLVDVTLTTEPLQKVKPLRPFMAITLGAYDSYKGYVKAMRSSGMTLGSAFHDTDRTVEAVPTPGIQARIKLFVVTPADLGFTSDVRRDDFYAQAAAYGLKLCPSEAALAFRLAYREQPRNETIWVASEPPLQPKAYARYGHSASPRVFGLRAYNDGALYLVSDEAYDDPEWSYIDVNKKYAFTVADE